MKEIHEKVRKETKKWIKVRKNEVEGIVVNLKSRKEERRKKRKN
jgi:hypothetical protein